ncbi:hypothetical protein D9611_012318 [Ephemerocybe angulata]|uniref:Uncharacterized protein n=1 Tax=Ephemerocybe angulata TaxID=980116 RepID=A0A8H5AT75_9AGAR|nr:hypothetical protein D9611_012318 [Tulosesus angulatus]
MHFKLVAIVPTALLYATTVVQAIDLRVFASSGCAGTALVCGNLAARQCCTTNTNPWASQMLSAGGNVGTTAFVLPGCTGGTNAVTGTTCLSPSFAVFSGFFFPLSGRRELLSGRAEDLAAAGNSTGECVEPDSYGYLDSAGKFHQAKIPDGKRAEVYTAFEKNDVEYFKAAF